MLALVVLVMFAMVLTPMVSLKPTAVSSALTAVVSAAGAPPAKRLDDTTGASLAAMTRMLYATFTAPASCRASRRRELVSFTVTALALTWAMLAMAAAMAV